MVDNKELTKTFETIIKISKLNDVEILFRQAGDGFLQVEYGFEPRLYVPDSFRILAINDLIKKAKINGLIETVPALRTNMFHYDPLVVSVDYLIDTITEFESGLKSLDDVVISSREIKLPIAFEDSQTQLAINKYVQQINSDAPNCINGSNLEYIALCNGVISTEAKKMFLKTVWFNSGCGFWPGGAYCSPLDPRYSLVVPKYNPPRTWTPEGAVGIGGPSMFTYTTSSGGGYQLFGRTIPTLQFEMRHPQFKISPFLFRSADRIQFYEVRENDIISIYEHVQNNTDYNYEITDGVIKVKEYIDWLNSDEVQTQIKKTNEKREIGIKLAPSL